ncbi:hypothetical protein Tco_1549604 [Tanacetum coccineum]
MAAFKVLETQVSDVHQVADVFDDEFVVIDTQLFPTTLNLRIPELPGREHEDKTQTTKDKVDSSKALDASLVDTESSGTSLKEQDTSSRSGNDAHADDIDIRPIYDEGANG